VGHARLTETPWLTAVARSRHSRCTKGTLVLVDNDPAWELRDARRHAPAWEQKNATSGMHARSLDKRVHRGKRVPSGLLSIAEYALRRGPAALRQGTFYSRSAAHCGLGLLHSQLAQIGLAVAQDDQQRYAECILRIDRKEKT